MAKDPLDLSDLFDPNYFPTRNRHKRKLDSNILSLDDMLKAPRRSRVAKEVVLFWTDWTCSCGRRYEMPTYGGTLTRYDQYKYGKVVASVYQKYLPANHAELPRRIESRHICIEHCPTCLAESQLYQDQQGDLFDETA